MGGGAAAAGRDDEPDDEDDEEEDDDDGDDDALRQPVAARACFRLRRRRGFGAQGRSCALQFKPERALEIRAANCARNGDVFRTESEVQRFSNRASTQNLEVQGPEGRVLRVKFKVLSSTFLNRGLRNRVPSSTFSNRAGTSRF